MVTARRFPGLGLLLVACAAAPSLSSCKSAYYSTMEKFGVHKREILVDRVEEAREDQEEAQEQFVSTFEQFKALTGFEGGELEKKYEKLNSSYEDCADKAQDVRDRIASVEEVSQALFDEWRAEIDEISNSDLKRKSSESLSVTKKRYGELVGAMKNAASGMDPVLTAFHDHVLFLKHNLNAQAIASLQDTVVSIQADVAKLIENMQASIREADEFISHLQKS